MSIEWIFPEPSTGLDDGLHLEPMSKPRSFRLVGTYEDAQQRSRKVLLEFEGVAAYGCTYLDACSSDQIAAYDKVVRVDESPWLSDVRARAAPQLAGHLQHYRIMQDDGPCYEFLCIAFHARIE